MYIFDRIFDLVFVITSRQPHSEKILKNLLKEIKLKFMEKFPNPDYDSTGNVSQYRSFGDDLKELMEKNNIYELKRMVELIEELSHLVRIMLIDDTSSDILYLYPDEHIDNFFFGYQTKKIVQAIETLLSVNFHDKYEEMIALSQNDYAVSIRPSEDAFLITESKIECREDLMYLGLESKDLYDYIENPTKIGKQQEESTILIENFGNLKRGAIKPRVTYLFNSGLNINPLREALNDFYRETSPNLVKSIIILGLQNIYVILTTEKYNSLFFMNKKDCQRITQVIYEGYHFISKVQ
jgi:hypothetical protein